MNITTRRSRVLLALLATACIVPLTATAEPARRALVIGIDQYTPEAQGGSRKDAATDGRDEWMDLSGAVADAQVFQTLLVHRFGFPAQNVKTLFNAEATRLNILTAIRDHLMAPSKPGDIVVLYYAGHGSQARNSASKEVDKLDETLVPADSWRGARDLRDKELARAVLNPLVDQGVQLTAIFDSCHSGSIGRGKRTGTPRFLPYDPRDISDPDEPPAPEDRGALIFSAAQPDEYAWEAKDDAGSSRGRFTWALQRALLQAAPGESAARIFQRTRALMAYAGEEAQEPVLAGTPERIDAPFLGDRGAAVRRGTIVAFSGSGKDDCQVQAGRALFLTPGTELVDVDIDPGAEAGKKPARIRITEVTGLDSSRCELVGGDAKHLAKGRLFRVEKFGEPDLPTLKVEVIASTLTNKALLAEVTTARTAAKKAGLSWAEDMGTEIAAGNLIRYAADGHWKLDDALGETIDLGAAPLKEKALASALAKVKAALGKEPEAVRLRLAMELPAPKAVVDALTAGTPVMNGVERGAPAQYRLAGRPTKGGSVELTWRRVGSDAVRSTFPPWTTFVPVGEDPQAAAASLDGAALQLAQINGWLSLAAPPADGAFPWRLELRDRDGNVPTVLAASKNPHRLVLRSPVKVSEATPRFIYIFILDSDGRMTPLYPRRNAGSVENRFPANEEAAKDEYVLPPKIAVRPPWGIDTYVMVTSSEPLGDPRIFQRDPVLDRSRGARGGGPKPTKAGLLFTRIGAGARGGGAEYEAPASWSVSQFSIESVPGTTEAKGATP